MMFCREVQLSAWEHHIPKGIMKLQLYGRFIIPYENHKDGPLNLLFLFLKYMIGIDVWQIPFGIM